ncbi:aerotolerance-related membrane protein BatA [Candidatus Omnitrophus magneticus]|uniref:Aerotolerance-related membrane protein BatA n=1 Tax=Candidatus Omnitrophus magneticus TaxID=1609969 RepID=A0A0F0CQZ3_9BACT|nr:aerotolerance-related membrane protein BatA [Candidatus Omnitrophus magneticus]
MRFENPWFLTLIFFALALFFIIWKTYDKKIATLRFSSFSLLEGIRPTLRVKLRRTTIFLRIFALIFLALAISRPQNPIKETKIFVEGIEIILVLDTSGSMRAMDFEINRQRVDRLTVVKNVVEQFIKNRPNDKIGIIAFSSLAYTICPLTLDHEWLLKNLERVKIGMIEDGTAIGSSISAALNRLKNSKAKDKIIILLTDGRNNAGKIDPLTAASAAKALGVRIYTIGAGTKGLAPYPVKNVFGETELQPVEIEIDDELLKKIADTTGSVFFRATDTKSLWDIYKEIDKLEKTKIEEVGYNRYDELFEIFLFPALIILLLEIILSNTLFRRIP